MLLYGNKKIIYLSIISKLVDAINQSNEYMKRYEYTGMTLTYLTAKSYLFPYAFIWEKDKNNMFVYNIKVGRCSQSNEYMKHYEYQRPSSKFTQVQHFQTSFP